MGCSPWFLCPWGGKKLDKTEQLSIAWYIVDISPFISIITLNVSGLNVPIKDQCAIKDCQNNSRNKIQLYVVYEKFTLNTKI